MEAEVGKPYCPRGAETEQARTYSTPPPETTTSAATSHEARGPAAPESAQRQQPPPHFEGFQRAMHLLGEYKEYASYYMSTKIDGIKSSVRNVGIYAGLGIVGLMAFSALISTAVALFLLGA